MLSVGTSTTQVSIRIWNFITFLDRAVFPKCCWRRPIFSVVPLIGNIYYSARW